MSKKPAKKRPITLNSLIFSDMKGNRFITETHMITFEDPDTAAEDAQTFISQRLSFMQKEYPHREIVIAPDMNETMTELEVKKVFKLTAVHFGITYEQIANGGGKNKFVEPRRVAINICKERKVQDYNIQNAIGIAHTMIVYHKREFNNLMTTNKSYAEKYLEAEEYVLTKLNQDEVQSK